MYGRWQSASARRFSSFLVMRFVGISLVRRFVPLVDGSCVLSIHADAMTELFIIGDWSLLYVGGAGVSQRDRVSFSVFHYLHRKPQIRPRRKFHQREMTNRRWRDVASVERRPPNRNDCIV